MFGLMLFLLAGCLALVAVGALVPGLFTLALVGLVLFTGTGMLAMAVHQPRRPAHRL